MKYLKINNETLFFIGYVLMLAGQILYNITSISHVTHYLTYIGFCILIICILLNFNKYTKKEIMILGGITFLVAIVTIISNDKIFAKSLIVLAAFKGINFEKFIKKDFKYRFLLVLIIVISSFIGLTDISTDLYRNGIRYSFGFQHPNNFAQYITILGFECAYILHNRKKLWTLLVMIIIFIINYFFINSRTSMILEFMMIMYLAIPHNYIKNILDNFIVRKLIIYSFALFLIFSLISCLIYSPNSTWLHALNEITSGRVAIAHKYLQNYSWLTLFGNNIPSAYRYINDVSNPLFLPLDNGYIHLSLIYGIILTILFMLASVIIFKKLYKLKNYLCIFILFLFN